jgi:hypothetical protein
VSYLERLFEGVCRDHTNLSIDALRRKVETINIRDVEGRLRCGKARKTQGTLRLKA